MSPLKQAEAAWLEARFKGDCVMTGQNYNKNLNCEKIFCVKYLN